MQVEWPAASQSPTPDWLIGEAYLAEARKTLGESLDKIINCLDQLGDEDLWWRAFESHNSIENIILHLCGNLHQWVTSAVGGAPDHRKRPKEFSERRKIPKSEVLATLRSAVAEADAALANGKPDHLLDSRRVQGFDTTILSAIFNSVSHFVGHTHQIVYITRLRVGDRYRFQWSPSTAEQGADRADTQ